MIGTPKRLQFKIKKNELIAQKNELSNKTSFWGSYSRNRKINKLNKRIESLDETLSTMSNLEGDKSTTYTLSNVSENGGVSLILEGEKKGMVSIASSSMSSFVHEVTHAGQLYSNDIGFLRTVLLLPMIFTMKSLPIRLLWRMTRMHMTINIWICGK